MTMELIEVANRLHNLASSFHAGLVEHGDEGQWLVSTTEMKAITVAAAMLGMFAEALDETAE